MISKSIWRKGATLPLIALLSFAFFTQESFAQLANWKYRVPITVYENSGSNLTDYQVPVTFDSQTPIAASKMNADGSDIRFAIDLNGDTLIDHWLESGINTNTTKVWIKVPFIAANDSVTVYLFYGNPAATSTSNVSNVFISQIDSVRASWHMDEGSGVYAYDASGNGLTGEIFGNPSFSTTAKRGPYSLHSPTGVDSDRLQIGGFGDVTRLDQAGDYSFLAWINITTNGGGLVIGFGDCCSPRNGYTMNVESDGDVRFWGGSDADNSNYNAYSTGTPVDNGLWHLIVIRVNSSSAEIVIDGTVNGTTTSNIPTSASVTFAASNVPFPPQIGGDGVSTSNNLDVYIDEAQVYAKYLTDTEIMSIYNNHAYTTAAYPGVALIRQYTASEPLASVGNEKMISSISVADAQICLGDSALLTVVIDSTSTLIPPYTYAWTPTATLSCSNCQSTYSTATSTTVYSVILTDSVGTTDSTGTTVTVSSALPVADAGNDTAMCEGQTIQLDGSGGVTQYWSPGSGMSDSTITNPSISPTSNTSYIYTAINGCGTDADTVLISVNVLPVLLSSDTAICPGDNVQLNASGAVFYQWDPGSSLDDSTIANPIASPTVTQVYSLTAVASSGCALVTTLTITVDSVSQIVAETTEDSLCLGDSAQFTVNDCGNTVFSDDFESGNISTWVDEGGGYTKQITTTSPANGTYAVEFINGVSGHLDGISHTFAADTPSTISWNQKSSSTSEYGGFVVIGNNPTGATDGLCYLYMTNSGAFYVYNAGTVGSYTANTWYYIELRNINWTAKTYDFFIDGTLISGGVAFSNAAITDINEVHLYNWSSTDNAYFDDVSIGNTCTPLDTSVTFSWTPTTGLSDPNISNPMASPTITTTYIVSANIGSCVSYDTLTIFVDTVNSISASGDTLLCDTATVQLNATGASTYSWSPSTGLSCTTCADPLASPLITTKYYVTSPAGCGPTDSVTVSLSGVSTSSVYSFSPDPKQGSGTFDGCSVNNTSDYVDWVEISSVNANTIHVKIQWYPASGGYTTTSGVHLRAIHYDGSSWTEIYSNLMIPSDFTVNTLIIDEFDYTLPPNLPLGTHQIRAMIIDRASSTDEFDTSFTCASGSAGTSGGSSRHYDNDDVSFDIIGSTMLVTTSNDTICLGDSAQLQVSAVDSTYIYDWTPGTGLSDSTSADPKASPSVTTTYILSVTDSFCTAVDTITIAVDTVNSITVSNDTAICITNTVALSASGGSSYLWSPGTGLSCTSCADPLATPTVSTMYYVQSLTGCGPTDSVYIGVTGTAQLSIDATSTALCIGDTSQLEVKDCGNTLFSDDFESGNISTWVDEGGGYTKQITTTSPANGTYAVEFVNGVSGHLDGISHTFTADTPTTISWNQKSTTTSQYGGFVVIGNNPAVTSDGLCYLYMTNSGTYYVNGAGTVGSYAANTWYFLELRNINWTAKTYDFYIDNVLEAGAVPFTNTGLASLNEIHLYNWTSTDNAYFDDITIGSICLPLDTGLTYSWTPATDISDPTISNPSVYPSVTTTYLVTVSDSTCSFVDSIEIVVDTIPNIVATGDTIMCAGDSVNLNVTGGTTYTWAPATDLSCTNCANPVASPSSDITYYVTTPSICNANDSVNIIVNGVSQVSLESNPTTLCIGDTAQLTVNDCSNSIFYDGFESGNIATWIDEGGGYTKQVTTTSPANGSYAVELVNGASAHLDGISHTFTNSTPDLISWYQKSLDITEYGGFVVIGNNPTGAFDGLTYIYMTNGGTYYLWNVGFIGTYAANQWYFLELRNINWTAKTYDFYIDGALLSAGVAFANTAITDINEVHLYNWSSTDNAYFDDVTIGDPCIALDTTVTYSWTPVGSLSDPNISNPLAYPTSTTTYTMTLNDNGCIASDTITIAVDSISNIIASGDTVLCAGESVTLGVTGGTTYAWTPATDLSCTSCANPVASPSSDITYYVTTPSICNANDSVSIIVNGVPQITLESNPTTLCIGDTAQLTVNNCSNSIFYDGFESGNIATWVDEGGGYTKQVTTTSPANGSYAVELVNGASAHLDGISHTFTNSTPDLISWYQKSLDASQYGGFVVIGNNPTGAFDGLTYIYMTNGGQYYLWNVGFIGSYAANQWYFLELRNINWTAKTYDFYIDGALLSAGVAFANTAITDINEVHLYNWSSTDNAYFDDVTIGDPCIALDTTVTYSWTPVGSLSDPNISNPLAYPTSTTTYNVTLNDNGCLTMDTITITVDSISNIVATGDATICAGGSSTLGVTGGTTYTWSPSAGLSCTSCANPVASPTVTTTYYVTTPSLCGASDSVTITVSGVLQVSASSTKSFMCPNDTSQLSVNDCGNSIFDDGFESGSIATWVDEGGGYTKQITTTSPANGSFAVELVGGASAHLDGISHTFTNSTPTDVSWYQKSTSTTQYGGFVVIGDNPPTAFDGLIYMYMTNGGQYYVDNVGFVGSYSANQWYFIELRNIDFITKTYDIYVDGALLTGGVAFSNTALTTINEIHLYNWSSTDNAYFDDITIGDVCTPIDTSATFSWTPASSLDNPNISNPVASPSSTTTYVVTVNNGSCTVSDSVTIDVDSTMIIATGDATVCSATNVQLDVTSSTTVISYSWLPTTALSDPSIKDPIASPATTTTYTVTITNINGCTFTDSVVITINNNITSGFSQSITNLDVQFTDMSIGATSWLWDFGDGFLSTLQNPAHTYAADSTYEVCLTATNSCGSDIYCDSITVSATSCPLTVAGFSYNAVGLTAVFTDLSTDATSWFWDFGDGFFTSLQNPIHAYTSDGTYYVCLSTTNACSSDTLCDSVTVSASSCTPTIAGFTFVDTGLTVSFIDTSTDATGWIWDFGDGGTSIASDPTYSYTASGTYTVCQTTTNPCSSDTICSDITVVGCTPTVASFSYADSALLVYFTDLSTDPITWQWDFGDGDTSSAQNPSHTYSADGSYTVCLITTNACGVDTSCITISVTSCPPAGAIFTFVDSAFTVTFTDSSYNAGTWQWDFGDGFFGNNQNPVHTYFAPGAYVVCLTVSNACSSDTVCQTVYVMVSGVNNEKPLAKIEIYPNPTDGILTVKIPAVITGKYNISVFNMLGEVVYFYEHDNNAQPMNSHELNLHHLTNGPYLIKVDAQDGYYIEELIFNK